MFAVRSALFLLVLQAFCQKKSLLPRNLGGYRMHEHIVSDIQPFRIHGNLYFVGCRKVSVHIIKTECGLIMIDTGYPDMYDQILTSMEALDLDPKDICAIFHSHGHIDHFGCTQRFQALSGAKTYISRIDNDIVNGTYDLSWAVELGLERLPTFDCDVLIDDGDYFTFGSTTIRCKLAPGHTDGTLAFFVNIEDGKSSIVAAMHGGLGKNTLRSDFLKRYGLPFDCREKFRNGLRELAKEHVDLVMGNHPGSGDVMGKLAKLLAGATSVLDPMEWQRLLASEEADLDALIKKDPEC